MSRKNYTAKVFVTGANLAQIVPWTEKIHRTPGVHVNSRRHRQHGDCCGRLDNFGSSQHNGRLLEDGSGQHSHRPLLELRCLPWRHHG